MACRLDTRRSKTVYRCGGDGTFLCLFLIVLNERERMMLLGSECNALPFFDVPVYMLNLYRKLPERRFS